jgi:hypothetical protein
MEDQLLGKDSLNSFVLLNNIKEIALASKLTNPDLFDRIEKFIEDYVNNSDEFNIYGNKREEAECVYIRKFYNELLDNYESLILTDAENEDYTERITALMESMQNTTNELEKLAKDNEYIEEQLKLMKNKFIQQNEELVNGASNQREQNIATKNIYESLIQLKNEHEQLLRSFEEDS